MLLHPTIGILVALSLALAPPNTASPALADTWAAAPSTATATATATDTSPGSASALPRAKPTKRVRGKRRAPIAPPAVPPEPADPPDEERVRLKMAAETARSTAHDLASHGRLDLAVDVLARAAEEHGLPGLLLDAAEQALHAPAPGRPGRLTNAARHLAAARGLLEKTSDGAPELLGSERAALRERAEQLEVLRTVRERQLTSAARSRGELAAGAAFAATSAVGFGVMAGGLALSSARQDRLDAIRGQEHRYDLRELDAYGRRADSMIAAGAVAGSLLLVLGIGLLAASAVEGKDARKPGRGRWSAAPTPRGVVLTF